MTDAMELLPCPWCGGEAEFSKGATGDGKDWHYIECAACAAMGPSVNYAEHNIQLREALADAWNTRAPSPAATLLAAEMRDRAATFVRTHAYTSTGSGATMEPSREPGADRHHATIADAIAALPLPSDPLAAALTLPEIAEMRRCLEWARGCVPFPSSCHSAIAAVLNATRDASEKTALSRAKEDRT